MKQHEANTSSAGLSRMLAGLGASAGSMARAISSTQRHGVGAASQHYVHECMPPQVFGLNLPPQGRLPTACLVSQPMHVPEQTATQQTDEPTAGSAFSQESGMADLLASLTTDSPPTSPEQGAAPGLSHPPQHPQAHEQAAWLQDMYRTMEEAEGEEEAAFMAGLFGRVPLTAEDADRSAAGEAASAAEALPSSQQGQGGPDAADTWALQLFIDPPASLFGKVPAEKLAYDKFARLKHLFNGGRSHHSATVRKFAKNHPSQQPPQVVPPGRAKDLLVLGTQLSKAGDYQKLFDVLEEGVQLEVPDLELKFWLYNNRGVAALILKDFVAAIFHLSVATNLKGSAWNPLLVRCEAYEAVGDYPAAAKDLEAVKHMGGMVDEDYLSRLRSMRKQPVHGAVLGVETDFLGQPLDKQASLKKWRQLCRQYHPDKVTAAEAKPGAVLAQQVVNDSKPTPAARQ